MSSLKSLLVTGLLATASAFAPINHNHGTVSHRTSSSALNVAIDTSDIKNGMTIEIDGEPYKILNFSIMKQARGAAKTTIKFKNLKRGNTIENTYISGKKLETAQIDRKASQYTYEDEVRVCLLIYIVLFFVLICCLYSFWFGSCICMLGWTFLFH